MDTIIVRLLGTVYLIVLHTQVQALFCYHCDSSSDDVKEGCQNIFGSEFLQSCVPTNKEYCSVARMTGTLYNTTLTQFFRYCSENATNFCEEHSNGLRSCYYSCKTDTCNSLNIFPYEASVTAAVTDQGKVSKRSMTDTIETTRSPTKPTPDATRETKTYRQTQRSVTSSDDRTTTGATTGTNLLSQNQTNSAPRQMVDDVVVIAIASVFVFVTNAFCIAT